MENPMDDLLDAFHYLQGENLSAASSLADQSRLSAIELRVLLIIRRMPETSTTTVASMIHYSIDSCTALVGRLVSGGYVEPSQSAASRGFARLHLTIEGRAVTELIRDFYRVAFARAVPVEHLANIALEVRDLADAIRAQRMQFDDHA